jgi:hypothetical protein
MRVTGGAVTVVVSGANKGLTACGAAISVTDGGADTCRSAWFLIACHAWTETASSAAQPRMVAAIPHTVIDG